MELRIDIPVVSVLLPCYNAEKYVEEAILSILNQTFRNFELILINDCSTDNTGEVLLKYANLDSRIVYVENRENLGLILTLNNGIKTAKGKYIARMDADDIAFPDRFMMQVDMLDSNDHIVICGGGIISFFEGQNIKEHKRIYPSNTSDIRAEALFNTPFAHPCVMIRKSTLFQYNLFYDLDYEYAEDYHLWQMLIVHGDAVNIVDFLLKYRVLNTSQTATGVKNQSERFKRISAIQNIGLKRIMCELNEQQLKFHYILSLSDYIKEIDFSVYNFQFIQNYFRTLERSRYDNQYCSSESMRKTLRKKYLKLVMFNLKRMSFVDCIRFVFNKRFVNSIPAYRS